MNNPNNIEPRQRVLTTADLAASANRSEQGDAIREDEDDRDENRRAAGLAPLFDEAMAGDFRARWNAIQQGFVDSPQNAVRQGDELVAQVIKSLAETFAEQRATFDGDHGSTEDLRLALRRYRSFFERLLSI